MSAFAAADYRAWLADVSEVATGWQLHATAHDMDVEAEHAAEIADAATAALAAARLAAAVDDHPTLFLTADEAAELESALDAPPAKSAGLDRLMRRAAAWATPDGDS